MVLVCALAPTAAQLAALGVLLSVLGALGLGYLDRQEHRDTERYALLERLAIPLTLAPEHELYGQYLAFTQALTNLADQQDHLLRDLALLKLASVTGHIGEVTRGTIPFAGTEAWQLAYEKLLLDRNVKECLSVVRLRGREYWQDEAGRQLMQATFEAA